MWENSGKHREHDSFPISLKDSVTRPSDSNERRYLGDVQGIEIPHPGYRRNARIQHVPVPRARANRAPQGD